MILTDGDIIELCNAEEPLIVPFNEKQLTPNGYDVSIKEIAVDGKTLEPREDSSGKKIVVIPGKKPFIVLTREWLIMPSMVVGTPFIKTKYARMGIVPAFGGIEAGFKGNLNLCAMNGNDAPIELCLDATFTQIMFHLAGKKPQKLYAQRSGNYQNQDKIMK